MPVRRAARRRETADLAVARVRDLLPDRPPAPDPAWVPPPLEEVDLQEPLEVPQSDRAQQEPLHPRADPQPSHQPVRAPASPAEVPDVPGVLDRLRAGRWDPSRPGVLGLAVVGLLACLLAGALLLRARPQEVPVPVVERVGAAVADSVGPPAVPPPAADRRPASHSAVPASAEDLVVAVGGKVRRPGLVRLAPGSRVDDALRAAGGVLPGADPGLLNLARKVADGEQVLVGVGPPPGSSSPAAPPSGGGSGLDEAPSATSEGTATDLNTATAGELDGLPGIGPVLAQRVVSWRAAHGPFRSVEQLREVPGIGEAKFATLRPRVRV